MSAGKAEPCVCTVFRQFGKNGERAQEQETIEVRQFPAGTAPAKVAYWTSFKINTGNYESVDIGVSLSVPCYLEEADEAFKYAEKFVGERAKKEHDDVRNALAAKKTGK